MADLFAYRENTLDRILEEHSSGATTTGEALLALVREEDVLQEVKARNTALVDFLGATVGGLLELVRLERPEAVVAAELLCSEVEEVGAALARPEHLEVVYLEGLLTATTDASLGRWERLAIVVARRFRSSLHRFFDAAPIVLQGMVARLDRGSVARAMAAALKRLESTRFDLSALVSRLADEPNAALVLLELGRLEVDDALIHVALAPPLITQDLATTALAEARSAAAIAVLKKARRPEDDLDDAVEALLAAGDSSRLGAHRLEAVRLACDAPSPRILPRCLDLFFAFPDNALLHRTLVACVCDLLDRNRFARLLLLDCRILPRAAAAATSDRPTSLRAHALLLCEAFANKLYHDLPRAPRDPDSYARAALDLPRSLLDAFLTDLAFSLSKRTLKKQLPSP